MTQSKIWVRGFMLIQRWVLNEKSEWKDVINDYEGGKKKGKGKKRSKMTGDHDRCDMAYLMVIVMVMMVS